MSLPYVHLNGRIVESQHAHISIFDRGLLYGDGIFETMRSYGGVVHLLRRHLTRLRDAATYTGIPLPGDEDLSWRIHDFLRTNNATDCALRLTVTRGVGGLVSEPASTEPTIIIHGRALPSRIPPDGERVVVLGTTFQAPRLGRRIKSLDYLPTVVAAQQFRRVGAGEGIYLNDEDEFVEGTVSNLFFVVDGELRTAPLSYGILPGITRGRIIELARMLGITVKETAVPHALLNGRITEAFYTNSLRELVPISVVGNTILGDGTIGMHTQRIRRVWMDECPGDV